MNHMTAEQRATQVYELLFGDEPVHDASYRIVLIGIKLAMRDQRHACAEALNAVDDVSAEAHNVVFNARV